MANEFHSGLARCVRTRVIGARMIRAAHEVGVRRPPGHAQELLEFLADTLADLGGTAGILRAQAPPPLDQQTGVDALVVSTDNELTGDEA